MGWGPGTCIPTFSTKVATEMTPGKVVKEARS